MVPWADCGIRQICNEEEREKEGRMGMRNKGEERREKGGKRKRERRVCEGVW